MKSDVIVVSSRGAQMEKTLRETELVAEYKGLSGKNALQLRLLTEEAMGMMRSITGETDGEFWIEDSEGVYELHLRVHTSMTSTKREQLLSTATSGKNESARGLMGRLRDFFDRGADEDVAMYANPLMMSGMYEYSTNGSLDLEWSMTRYEEALNARTADDDSEAREAWDELEKSVVAKVADDVKVSIRGNAVELIIIKKFA